MEEMKKFRKGEVIFREWEFQLWMYDLFYVMVVIYVDYGRSDHLLVSTNDAPSFFGEVELLESMPRFAASVVPD